MAELVDACVSGAHAARCAGSSPVLGTCTKCCAPLLGPPQILICGESGGLEDFNESVIQSVSERAERERRW